MALKNAAQAAQPATTPTNAPAPAPAAAAEPPPFEPDEPNTIETVESASPAAAAAPTAPAAANVPAVPSGFSKSLAIKDETAARFAEQVAQMKGACDFSYGNYQVFKGNNGTVISTGENKVDLGRWVKVAMIGWDDHWEISPGSDSKESRDFVAYSKDGEVIDRIIGEELRSAWVGKPVKDYVQYLRTTEEYSDADSRRFIDVGCVLLESENDQGLAGEVIQITLSQTSIPSFSQYQERLTQKARAVARGIPGVKVPEDPFTFYFLRELASMGSNNWTKLKVVDQLPSRI